MTGLEKLTEAVSLLAYCVEEQDKTMKRLLDMYKILDYRLQCFEHDEDCLIGSYDRDSSLNEDKYITYPCTCKE